MNEKADSIADAIMSKTPRRAHLEKNIPAELAIRNAMAEVEKLGAHPGLTYAVIHLHDALTDVADWYDNGAPGAYPQPDVSLTDKVCADPNISPAFKAAIASQVPGHSSGCALNHGGDKCHCVVPAAPPTLFCSNCESPVPPGCGGLFKEDGDSCALVRRLSGKTVPA